MGGDGNRCSIPSSSSLDTHRCCCIGIIGPPPPPPPKQRAKYYYGSQRRHPQQTEPPKRPNEDAMNIMDHLNLRQNQPANPIKVTRKVILWTAVITATKTTQPSK